MPRAANGTNVFNVVCVYYFDVGGTTITNYQLFKFKDYGK